MGIVFAVILVLVIWWSLQQINGGTAVVPQPPKSFSALNIEMLEAMAVMEYVDAINQMKVRKKYGAVIELINRWNQDSFTESYEGIEGFKHFKEMDLPIPTGGYRPLGNYVIRQLNEGDPIYHDLAISSYVLAVLSCKKEKIESIALQSSSIK